MRIHRLPARDVQPIDARARAEANAAWLGWLAARAATTPSDLNGAPIFVTDFCLIRKAVKQARRAIGWRRVLDRKGT